MVFSDLLDNPGAEVLLIAVRVVLLTLAVFVVLDVPVDANLFTHDALNVDLVWVVVVLYQSSLDGLFQSVWVHRQVLVWNQLVDQVFLGQFVLELQLESLLLW